eukprot:GHVU01068159.1.p1 GENE.GHVU01068159.1~~GHVU01068159.1.p1  ORF type:complete len:168 (-),score=21.52 GHVU01068159.1:927-1430(-)
MGGRNLNRFDTRGEEASMSSRGISLGMPVGGMPVRNGMSTGRDRTDGARRVASGEQEESEEEGIFLPLTKRRRIGDSDARRGWERVEEAVNQLRDRVDRLAASELPQIIEGRLKQMEGRIEEAVQLFQQALRRHPSPPTASAVPRAAAGESASSHHTHRAWHCNPQC